MHRTESPTTATELELATVSELTQRFTVAASLVQTAFQEQSLRFLRPLVRGAFAFAQEGQRLNQAVIESDLNKLQNEINPLVRELSLILAPTNVVQLRAAVGALEEFHRILVRIQTVDEFRVFLDRQAQPLLTKAIEQTKAPLIVAKLHPAVREYLRKVSPLRSLQE